MAEPVLWRKQTTINEHEPPKLKMVTRSYSYRYENYDADTIHIHEG